MPRVSVLALVVSLVACGDDITEAQPDAGEGAETTNTDETTTSVGSTAMTDTQSSLSATGQSEGSNTSDTGGTSGKSDDGDTTETTAPATATEDTTSAEAESTGRSLDCADLDAKECEDEQDCMPIEGRPFVHENGPHWCLGELEFAGCVVAQRCDEAEVVGCSGPDAWAFTSDCLPAGWSACDPPAEPEGDCKG